MKPARASNPIKQRQAMVRQLERRMACEGKIVFPAVPSMADDYADRCERLFAALGRRLNEAERAELHTKLLSQLELAFAQSQRSNITISYQAKVSGILNYFISPQYPSVEQAYDEWVSTREPPYFGVEPDAKVLALAQQACHSSNSRVLDIGAGTGRNALALARLGLNVDAVEMTPKFADILSEAARKQSLPVNIIRTDILKTKGDLFGPYALIVLSEVVSDFRSVSQLRTLFELASQLLAPGGTLLLNAFLTQPHYCADDAAREFGQLVYTGFFTQIELSEAFDGLPLELVSSESVYDYEQTNLPTDAWPPTKWYTDWVSGLDLFSTTREDSPIEFRWLLFRRTGTEPNS